MWVLLTLTDLTRCKFCAPQKGTYLADLLFYLGCQHVRHKPLQKGNWSLFSHLAFSFYLWFSLLELQRLFNVSCYGMRWGFKKKTDVPCRFIGYCSNICLELLRNILTSPTYDNWCPTRIWTGSSQILFRGTTISLKQIGKYP